MAQLDPNDGTAPTWWDQQPPPPPTFTPDPGHGTAVAPPPTFTPSPTSNPVTPYPSAGVPAGPNSHWDPVLGYFVPNVTPTAGPTNPASPTGAPPTAVGPGPMPQSGYGGFGIAPAPYASDPNAPTYTPLPTYTPPVWTGGDYVNPTEADLEAMPGYQSQLDAGLQARNRAAAAQGTVLNGGTLKALDRYGTDYAATGYQTLRNNTLQAYQQKYQQFTDAAGMDLNARTLNANNTQNTYTNNLNTYQAGNARTLSDYLTNVNAQRTAKLDYWSQLQDTSTTGAGLAGGSR